MSTDKALQIFDQLVTSIGLYNCEYWLPLIMTKKSFSNSDSTFSYWGNLQVETINQKICRMILGVQKKSSRLGTLGELGRFPLFVKGLCHVLKFHALICQSEGKGTLISHAVAEMKSSVSSQSPNNSWFGRIEKLKENLNINYQKNSKIDSIGFHIKKQVKSKFENFWLAEINKVKPGPDNLNHNKLRYYATFKGCFKREEYINLVPNRSQRSDLTRLRISSSRLGVEILRYRRPKIPENQRYCRYCTPSGNDNHLPGYVDNELHLLVSCSSFTLKRNCLFGRMESIRPGFLALPPNQKAATLLCPTSVLTAKLSNKYISILFNIRKKLDEGVPALNIGYKYGVLVSNEFYDDNLDSCTNGDLLL